MCVGKVNSRIKGHNVYEHDYSVGEELDCKLEPNNQHSRHAIVVKTLNDGTVVGHVPEALTKKLQPLIKSWKLYRVTARE